MQASLKAMVCNNGDMLKVDNFVRLMNGEQIRSYLICYNLLRLPFKDFNNQHAIGTVTGQ